MSTKPNISKATNQKEQAVLTKAVVRAAGRLGITNRKLATVIGISPSSVSRISANGDGYCLTKNSKEWELGVLFVRMFRSLNAITGDSGTNTWLNSENNAFGYRKPIDIIDSTEGLVHVCNYLDAHRGVI